MLVLLGLISLHSSTCAQAQKTQEPTAIPTLINPDDEEQQARREAKIAECAKDYIEKQSKSSRQKVQKNLYDLLLNFDNIVMRLNNKKIIPDSTSFQERLEAVAKLQCELFFNSKILK